MRRSREGVRPSRIAAARWFMARRKLLPLLKYLEAYLLTDTRYLREAVRETRRLLRRQDCT